LWQPENVKITRGEDNIGTFSKTPQSHRKWCKTCGGHVFTRGKTIGYALGQSASGSIDVAEDYVRLEVFLPWLLAKLIEPIQR
jgi:hypothetical protein